jgi:peptidoglycan/xylan/chitin deacetylase (PgdA/CDA1 family)
MIASGAARNARRRHQNTTLVLAYHNIIPTGEQPAGDRSLHLPQRSFARQLDLLLRTHTVISVRDALEPTTTHTSDRPRVVITFDDAYVGAMTAGMQELRRRGLPATVFVAPGRMGGQTFWWDTLASPTTGLSTSLRDYALEHAQGREETIMEWARQNNHPVHDVPSYATSADSTLLQHALETHSGLMYGVHTWTHPNLNRLDEHALHTELHEPLQWLAQYGKRAIAAIAYPYGLANASVHQAAEQAGYVAGFMIDGGWMRDASAQRHALPRLNIPAGVSDAGFELRASGLITH